MFIEGWGRLPIALLRSHMRQSSSFLRDSQEGMLFLGDNAGRFTLLLAGRFDSTCAILFRFCSLSPSLSAYVCLSLLCIFLSLSLAGFLSLKLQFYTALSISAYVCLLCSSCLVLLHRPALCVPPCGSVMVVDSLSLLLIKLSLCLLGYVLLPSLLR